MNNIYAFHGADHKVGVTMTALSTAQHIASQRADRDVLFLVLSGKQNTEFIEQKTVSIEKFKNRLDSGLAIYKSDIGRSKDLKNLFLVSGISSELNERYYTPKTALDLIKDLAGQFSYIILDTGSRADNGLAIGGLACAVKKYLILSQNEAVLRRYERNKDLYENMKIQFDKRIINKYCNRDPYTAGYIGKRLNADLKTFATIGRSEAGRKAEREYKTLLQCKDSKYIRDIGKITEEIFPGSEAEAKEKSGKVLFGRLFKANT